MDKLTYYSPMIDIGVNLSNSRLMKRIDELMENALTAQVKGMILTGTDPKNSLEYIELINQLEQDFTQLKFWSTAGVHPHDAEEALTQTYQHGSWLQQILACQQSSTKVIAVGECGLDYDRNYSSPRDQRLIFEQQLELAVQVQKPLFLHQRAAQSDFIDMLKTYHKDLAKRGEALAAVVHCFTDDQATLEHLLELGCYIGITGWIADERRAENLRKAVTCLPLNRVLIETDAPYLLPRTLRPKPKNGLNQPAYLPHIAEQLAIHMQTDVNALIESALHNTMSLFQIDLE